MALSCSPRCARQRGSRVGGRRTSGSLDRDITAILSIADTPLLQHPHSRGDALPLLHQFAGYIAAIMRRPHTRVPVRYNDNQPHQGLAESKQPPAVRAGVCPLFGARLLIFSAAGACAGWTSPASCTRARAAAMPPADVEDTWSDSDEDLDADIETSVDLGVPDGPVDDPAALLDATVSRIGGHPTFLAAPHPPTSHAACNNCHQSMELLIQIWCPLEESPNDRVLYVWACANGACQRKDGSVRAWRELRYNKKYAEKLERKLARRKAKEAEAAKAAEAEAAKKAQPKSNPFALGSASAPAPNPFGLGSQVFGGAPAPEPQPGAGQTESAGDDGSPVSGDSSASEDEDEEDADAALTAGLHAASLDDSPWKAAPSYPALYLSTVSEYLPPPPKIKVPAGATADPDDDKSPKGKDGLGGWDLEGYENSLDVDHAFERFSKRVSYEGEQCLRYERGGTPLPFASDKVFDRLFPVPPAPALPVTKPDFMVTPPRKRTYTPEALPRCPHCQSRRVFECQLMPNLINVLRAPTAGGEGDKKLTDEERRAEVLKALRGAPGRRGMEWGTCMVFACEKDCSAENETGSSWREECVLVQWDE